MTPRASPAAALRGAGRSLRGFWERVILYLPVLLMGLLALFTFWMIQRSPGWIEPPQPRKPVGHEVDFYMRGAMVKSYDRQARLQSEIAGREIRHYGDDPTLQVDQPQLYLPGRDNSITPPTAEQALSLIHLPEPTRLRRSTYAGFCLKKKKKKEKKKRRREREEDG